MHKMQFFRLATKDSLLFMLITVCTWYKLFCIRLMYKFLLTIVLVAFCGGVLAQHKKKRSARKHPTEKHTPIENGIGIASYYSDKLQGSKTATGERFDNQLLTAASNSFKLQTWVRVTNLSNNKQVVVRINDRMHRKMVKRGRIIDVSKSAAVALDFIKNGLVKVKVEITEAPTDANKP